MLNWSFSTGANFVDLSDSACEFCINLTAINATKGTRFGLDSNSYCVYARIILGLVTGSLRAGAGQALSTLGTKRVVKAEVFFKS